MLFHSYTFDFYIKIRYKITRQNLRYNLSIKYFNYCSEVWGHCNKSLSNKLQKLQNRAARILTFSSYDTSADPLFEQLNWRRLDTQRQIQVATMVYLTNRFHVAVRLFSNRSQLTSKCGKNKKVAHEA